MADFATFQNFSELVDVMCLWPDAERGAFPGEILCGPTPTERCAVRLAAFSGLRADTTAALIRLAEQCDFEIEIEAPLDFADRLKAVPLEKLPGWSNVFRDPFAASHGGENRRDAGTRHYVLGSKTAEKAQQIWQALRACRAPGLAARAVPEAAVVGDCPYRYFWLVTSGLPVDAPDGQPLIPLPPPISILQLADHAWWQLPVESEGDNTRFYFEWPFEPALSAKALRALAQTGGDAILLSRHAPRHIRLAQFADDRVFREVIEVFPLACPQDTFTSPRIEPQEHMATFDIDLRLVKQVGPRAVFERDRGLEVAINSLVLRRSRRKALDIRMGRLGQSPMGPFAFDKIDELPPELRAPFRQWIESDDKQRQRFFIRSVFVEPLMVYVAPPDDLPEPIRDLLTDFAGQDVDLHALRHIRLPAPPFPEWGLGADMPAHVHIITTTLALGGHVPAMADITHLRTLGLRLLDYGRQASARFDLSADWADPHELRLFLPRDRQLEFYPHIEPSPLAAKKIAAAVLPPASEGGDPRDEWCALVLPGVGELDPVRCVHLRLADFRPLSEAFAWDCRSTATTLQPDVTDQLKAGADALAATVSGIFDVRARQAIAQVIADRISEVDRARDALEKQTARARDVDRRSQETASEGARIDGALDLVAQTQRRQRVELTTLSEEIGRAQLSAEHTRAATDKLLATEAELTELKRVISAMIEELKQ